jgi:hypothetical protein
MFLLNAANSAKICIIIRSHERYGILGFVGKINSQIRLREIASAEMNLHGEFLTDCAFKRDADMSTREILENVCTQR